MNATEQSPQPPVGPVSERAVPYHCPFCGEEDLRPVPSGSVDGLTRGGWHCRSCLRIFSLQFFGTHQPFVESDPR
jgi:transposase-like protein